MKARPCLLNGLIIVFPAILLCGIGVLFAYRMFLVYDLPWKHTSLPPPPDEIVDIVHIDFQSYMDDPTGDTIFVAAKDGAVYSNTLFGNEWLPVESVPDWGTDYTNQCAPTWPGAQSDAPIWDPPPVEKKVADSAGVRFEHAMAIAVRCYVLSDDGSLDIWAREDDVSIGVAPFVLLAPVMGILGALVGALAGLLIVYLNQRRKAPAT